MDWVERLFGISPDNGSGLFEFAIIAMVVLVLLLIYRERRRTRRHFHD